MKYKEKMGTIQEKEKDIAGKYGNELITLRVNSKPLINSLTMMAEDYIKQAPIVVQTIEKHLSSAKSDVKLPILYLIDSIVKNVKRDYITLFTQNIVSTFCGVFEKVDEKTRSQMFKLRQTWSDIYPVKKLYAIDHKAHGIDPGWPVIGPAPSIHLNPKFLNIKTSDKSLTTSSPSYELGKSVMSVSSELDEARMREQLLIKQKELIELQQKKLELELMQAKARLEVEVQAKRNQEKDDKEEQLWKKVDKAKKQTESIMAKVGTYKHVLHQEPRRSSSPVVKENPTSSKKVSPMVLDKNEKFAPDPRSARTSHAHKVKSEGKKEREKETYPNRKSAVLSRNYRKRPETNFEDEDQDRSKKKLNPTSSKKVSPMVLDKNEKFAPDPRLARTSNVHKVKSEVKKEREKETYVNRQSAVLSRNYRKRPETNFEDEDQDRSKKKLSTDSTAGDVDLRFEGLQDVDLRRDGSDADAPSPSKKLRRSAFIDDLFGREDVDLRQPSGTNWSQVKKPTSSPASTPSKESIDSELPNDDKTTSQSLDGEVREEDIRQVLGDVGNRPPPAASPANSVDSVKSTCDPLGRPLLFARLPANPEERKRSLDTRSTSIDPLEQFRSGYLETPGGLTDLDLKIAYDQAKVELDNGTLNSEQYGLIIKQLIQLNEAEKIRRMQEMHNSNGAKPNVWAAGKSVWAVDRPNFPPRAAGDFARNRFPVAGAGPWAINQWSTNSARPVGPNPFIEAAISGSPQIDLIPDANPLEVKIAERDFDTTIPLDKVIRQIRFYGDTTIVFLGMLGDEPRDISFQRAGPKIVYINKEPFKIFIGEDRFFYTDKKKHTIRIGTPKRELYIDNEGYEACFTGVPVQVKLDGRWHTFKLEGPPPQVEIGKIKRYDLVAGRVTLFIDTKSTSVYLDENPQVIALGGVPVILRFCNDFHAFTLNGRTFPTSFGGNPMSVSLRNGRQHFLRFGGVTPATEYAISEYVRTRQEMHEGIPHDGYFGPRGRGGRGRRRGADFGMGRGNSYSNRPEFFERFHSDDDIEQRLEDNPLDMLANIFQTSDLQGNNNQNQKNSYKSETLGVDETSKDETSEGNVAAGLSVQDLLSKLMKAGLLPTSGTKDKDEKLEPEPKPTEAAGVSEKDETTVVASKPVETETPEVPEKEEKKKPEISPPPALEVVNVTFGENLKERRDKLIIQICTGVQCGSCGLRFAPNQSFRYTQHLDWHFRVNRRDKKNFRKAQSRRWYYDLSDWIQFEEIDDLEEAEDFEFQETDGDKEGEVSRVLNPDAYTVLAAGFENATCPQCGEGFETFYESEEDEWRIRDALVDQDIDEQPILFHPICHEDYIAALAKQGAGPIDETLEPDNSVIDIDMVAQEDDDDEVLILKEGKKEVVVMEIDVEEEEQTVNNSEMIQTDDHEKMPTDKIESENNNLAENVGTVSNNNDSINNNTKSILSPIVIHVEDDIPGITGSQDGSGVFDFALGSNVSSQNHDANFDLPAILYNSMQFDFPKIKVEPPEWESLDANQIIMSKEYVVDGNQTPMDITLEDDDYVISPPPTTEATPVINTSAVDIDLTEDDDESSQNAQINLVSAIDGNLEFRSEGKVSLMSVPTKIRINISGLDSPASPGNPSSSQEDKTSKKSPNPHNQSSDDNTKLSISLDSSDNEKRLEEIKRMKPRLVGKKLVNCPPRRTAKEESGLCVIC